MDPTIQEAPVEAPPPTNKKRLFYEVGIEAFVVVGIIAFLLIVFSYFKIISLPLPFSKNQTSRTQTPPQPTQTATSSAFTYPVNPHLATFNDVSVRYNGTTTIASVFIAGEVTVIKLTNIQETKDIPLTFDTNTKIVSGKDPKQTLAATDIKKDNKVSFSLSYSIKDRSWRVISIVLLDK